MDDGEGGDREAGGLIAQTAYRPRLDFAAEDVNGIFGSLKYSDERLNPLDFVPLIEGNLPRFDDGGNGEVQRGLKRTVRGRPCDGLDVLTPCSSFASLRPPLRRKAECILAVSTTPAIRMWAARHIWRGVVILLVPGDIQRRVATRLQGDIRFKGDIRRRVATRLQGDIWFEGVTWLQVAIKLQADRLDRVATRRHRSQVL